MASQENMPAVQVNRLYEVISAQLATLQQFGYAVCIRAPKNTFVFCFEVQKKIVFFPFNCAKTIFDKIKNAVGRQVNRPKPPTAAEIVTGVREPTEKEVTTASRELRNGGLCIISRKSRLGQYQKVLEKWCSENCKNIDSFTFNAEDEVVKAVAASLKHLKALKSRKSRLNEAFSDTLTNMAERDYITQNELRLLKNNIKNMSAINSEMKEKRKTCLSIIDSSNKLGHLLTKIILQNDAFCDSYPPGCAPDISFGLSNKIKTVLNKAKMENISIKSNVTENSEKIEAILKMTENISVIVHEIKDQLVDHSFKKEFCKLQGELEKEKQILVSVVEDRNSMKEKLDILLTLMEDQEQFLNARDYERTEFQAERQQLEALNNIEHPLYYHK